MTDERLAQARAEAERQIHVYGDDFKARTLRANLNDAFVQGAEWADANPQPHTITREQAIEAFIKVMLGRLSTPNTFVDTLREMGIEVEDGDE